MSSEQNFACPSCGGRLAYAGTAPTMVCNYCGNTIAVPAELRQPALNLAAQQMAGRTMRWIVIFIVVVVVLPTCIGLGATLIGVAASIIAPIFAILVAIFGQR